LNLNYFISSILIKMIHTAPNWCLLWAEQLTISLTKLKAQQLDKVGKQVGALVSKASLAPIYEMYNKQMILEGPVSKDYSPTQYPTLTLGIKTPTQHSSGQLSLFLPQCVAQPTGRCTAEKHTSAQRRWRLPQPSNAHLQLCTSPCHYSPSLSPTSCRLVVAALCPCPSVLLNPARLRKAKQDPATATTTSTSFIDYDCNVTCLASGLFYSI
jgi:hypothetical protein